MAAIGSIRKRSGLLILLIGASIVGFLVMDATNSQVNVFKSRNTSIAKVNGEKISVSDYNKRYDEAVKAQEDQAKQQGIPFDEDAKSKLKNTVWNEMVEDLVFKIIHCVCTALESNDDQVWGDFFISPDTVKLIWLMKYDIALLQFVACSICHNFGFAFIDIEEFPEVMFFTFK